LKPASAQEPAVVSIPSSSDAGLETITNSIGMKLVPISAGRFTMGSPASERGSQEDELLHKVELTQSFHMGATEVTEHQWAMVMEEPFRTEIVQIRDPETKRLIKKEEKQIKNPKLDSKLPITNISWSKAVEFCNRLRQLPEEKKEGRNYRLPTEAEWEYACRSGTSTAYSFGDEASMLDDYAWYQANGGKVMPVASRKPNAWGLYDTHGNVYEWCYDFYGRYSEILVQNPSMPDTFFAYKHVIRGGAADSRASQCRSGFRNQSALSGKHIGFRIVFGEKSSITSLKEFTNSIGIHLIALPAGRFGKVEVDSFQIGKMEITQRQWKSVMGTEPWSKGDVPIGEDYAASFISWEDAVEFCKKLSNLPEEKLKGRLYRLPTEKEWEFACRAGMETAYSYGEDPSLLHETAWFGGAAKQNAPQLVGQKVANDWGLQDMHGNVSEWCSDWREDPSFFKVFRGGSWASLAEECTSAFRSGYTPKSRNALVGFRVALDPPVTSK
jgi:formylglycine-generating enzyme required for sulfatase activity